MRRRGDDDDAYDDDDEDRPRRRARRDDDDDYDDDEDRPRRRARRDLEEDIGDDAGMRMLLPVGRSGWAIAAGYLGLISVLCLPSPFALIAGLLAIRDMRRNPKLHGMGRAIFGIVMGGIGTVFLILILFFAALDALKK